MISDSDLAALAAPTRQPELVPITDCEFEALAYMLREGPSALSRPEVVERLARLDPDQLHQIIARLIRRSPSNAVPWKPDEIRSLKAIRKEGRK